MNKKILSFLLFFSFLHAYEINFQGIKDKKIIKTLKASSNVEKLETLSSLSANALKYQTKNYIAQMIKTLNNYGYYDAEISYDVKNNMITFHINHGIRYNLTSYEIYEQSEKIFIDLDKINIKLNSYTNSKEINDSKYKLLQYLAMKGYPLAKIETFDITADYNKKSIYIKVKIEKGPLCHFGSLSISGLKNIHPRYIYRKIAWKEGDIYSLKKVLETQNRIINTNLFSSVSINHKGIEDNESLPMKIDLIESKHQSISLGISYATVDGYGTTFGWIHRNIRKMGEILSFQAEIATKAHTGTLSYIKPDFLWFNQDLIFEGYAQREDIKPYLSFTYGISSRISHRLTKRFKYSYGIKIEHIKVKHSANNGIFQLINFPFYFRYDTVNHLLNPTKGYSFIYIITPSKNIIHDKSTFVKQRFTTSLYIPTQKSKKLVFALRLQLGSILGSSLFKIPLTKLFLGGSDDDLRGYKYKTVGPRNENGKIIGGKSSIYFNFEPRLRLTKTIGLVPFLDVGNIQRDELPTLKGKWRKSLGIGLRYFTFFGPLRLDAAFPLNRYKKDDPRYRIYISIGQTF